MMSSSASGEVLVAEGSRCSAVSKVVCVLSDLCLGVIDRGHFLFCCGRLARTLSFRVPLVEHPEPERAAVACHVTLGTGLVLPA